MANYKRIILICVIGLFFLVSPISALIGNNSFIELQTGKIDDNSITWYWNNTLVPTCDLYFNGAIISYNFTGNTYSGIELRGGNSYTLNIHTVAVDYLDTKTTLKTSEQKTQDFIDYYKFLIFGLVILIIGMCFSSPIIIYGAEMIFVMNFILVTLANGDIIQYGNYYDIVVSGFFIFIGVVIAYAKGRQG
jgi:hypothetical protein